MSVETQAISIAGFTTCPLPKMNYDHVLLGHGSGGQLTADLIRRVFLQGFDNAVLHRLEDQAVVELAPASPRLAFTTDSFVVQPLFFPGGDIGRLAVCGTVNDLAVGGARPLFISAAFILEEGLPIQTLTRIVESMRAACEEAGVALVAGDTKVIDRNKTGRDPEVFITTSGVGVVADGVAMSIASARPGDVIVCSGTIGDHGVTIMSAREGIDFETGLTSDCAPLNGLTCAMLAAAPHHGAIRCMRDATRGGISSVLNELADASKVGVEIDESAMPIRPEVHAACEMLGLDPLYVANEGKLIAVVAPEHAEAIVAAMRLRPLGADAAIIGRVMEEPRGMVILKSLIGGERVVTMLAGEQLPRIC